MSDDTPRETIRAAGVTDDQLTDLEDRIEQAVDAILDTHGEHVDYDTSEQADIIVAVQDEILHTIADAGTRSDDTDIPEWFDRIASDFADPASDNAAASVKVALGTLAMSPDAPSACGTLAAWVHEFDAKRLATTDDEEEDDA